MRKMTGGSDRHQVKRKRVEEESFSWLLQRCTDASSKGEIARGSKHRQVKRKRVKHKRLNDDGLSWVGELSSAEIDSLMTIFANPRQFKIPDWFLNRKNDYKDGKFSQVTSNALDMKLRDDLERLKKIRGLRVRGQQTKTTCRREKTVGVSKKR